VSDRLGHGGGSGEQAPPVALLDQAGAAGLTLSMLGRRLDVVLDAPQRRNAQTPATWEALAEIGAWAAGTADVVVVRAEGPSFSAGLDRGAFTPEGIPGQLGLAQLAALPDDDLDAVISSYQVGFVGLSRGPS
jgi:enoyl-CoA hydratase/carnithine racemase